MHSAEYEALFVLIRSRLDLDFQMNVKDTLTFVNELSFDVN